MAVPLDTTNCPFRCVGKHEICEGTVALQLTKPATFHFRAGQYVDQHVEMTVIKPRKKDLGGNSRDFFHCESAPFEDKLMFVMRLSNSAFKELRSLAWERHSD